MKKNYRYIFIIHDIITLYEFHESFLNYYNRIYNKITKILSSSIINEYGLHAPVSILMNLKKLFILHFNVTQQSYTSILQLLFDLPHFQLH
jgi:hypothetical protein